MRGNGGRAHFAFLPHAPLGVSFFLRGMRRLMDCHVHVIYFFGAPRIVGGSGWSFCHAGVRDEEKSQERNRTSNCNYVLRMYRIIRTEYTE